MTPQTPKEIAIEKAYGEYWEQVKYHVDEDGWCHYFCDEGFSSGINPEDAFDYDIKNQNDEYYDWRPKSLSGIETNNGWHRIDEVGLPKDYGDFWLKTNDDILPAYFTLHRSCFATVDEDLENSSITHYQPIQNPDSPIY